MAQTGAGWIPALGCAVLVAVAGCAPAAPPPPSPQDPSPPTRPPASSAISDSAVKLPPAGARFSYQLGGPYPAPAGVGVVGRDRSADPVVGMYSICYVNAFQAQAEEVTWWQQTHPDLLLRNDGGLVVDEQWNEPLLDTNHPERLMDVVGQWIDDCARAGYQAVEADNLDSYTRSDGLLDAADALRFGRLIADRAHADGIALGQKNSAELAAGAHAEGFDFAISEECQVYNECDEYTDVYGDALIEVEYSDQDPNAFATACRERGAKISVVRRDRELAPAGRAGHLEQWC